MLKKIKTDSKKQLNLFKKYKIRKEKQKDLLQYKSNLIFIRVYANRTNCRIILSNIKDEIFFSISTKKRQLFFKKLYKVSNFFFNYTLGYYFLNFVNLLNIIMNITSKKKVYIVFIFDSINIKVSKAFLKHFLLDAKRFKVNKNLVVLKTFLKTRIPFNGCRLKKDKHKKPSSFFFKKLVYKKKIINFGNFVRTKKYVS